MPTHHHLAATAIVLGLGAGPVLADTDDQCRLEFDFETVTDAGGRERRYPEENPFRYGEKFEMVATGTYPGLFCIETINPAQETYKFDPIDFDGTGLVRLPCGPTSVCDPDLGPQFFELKDDDEDGPKGVMLLETMLLRYYPCWPEDEDAQSRTPGYNRDLPACNDAPKTCPPRPVKLANFESIALSAPRTQGCTSDEDSTGRVLLHKSINLRVLRQ